MASNNTFNIHRLKHFIERQVTLQLKTYLIAFAAFSGLLTLIAFLTSIDNGAIVDEAIVVIYYVFLLGGGFFATSRVFNEMHPSSRGVQFLTLPISRIEHIVTAWIMTSLVFVLASLIFFYSSYYLASFLSYVSFGIEINPINLGVYNFKLILAIFFVCQPVFLLGAVSFKKHHFLKTLLAIFLVGLALMIIAALLSFALNGFRLEESQFHDDSGFQEFMKRVLLPILYVMFWGLLAPFCLTASYLKLKEREL